MTGKCLKRNRLYCLMLGEGIEAHLRKLFVRLPVKPLRIRHGTGSSVIGVNIIERAYQLAAESGSIEEVKRKLMREGYLSVHSHLSGHQIRHDLLKRLNPQLVTYRKERAANAPPTA
jgi:hypothetical protein